MDKPKPIPTVISPPHSNAREEYFRRLEEATKIEPFQAPKAIGEKMDFGELCEYLQEPEWRLRKICHQWRRTRIPKHTSGKRLFFYKREIDAWWREYTTKKH